MQTLLTLVWHIANKACTHKQPVLTVQISQYLSALCLPKI